MHCLPNSQKSNNSTRLTEVIKMFASLIVEVYRSINESENNLKRVKDFLCKLKIFKCRSANNEFLLHHILDEIKSAQSAFDLILLLMPYWSCYNYKLLDKLIHTIGSEKVKEKLRCFVLSLKALKMFELPPLIQPVTNECAYHSELLVVEVQCDFTKDSFEELWQIQEHIATLLENENYSLLLKRIRKDSSRLEYFIPNVLNVNLKQFSQSIPSLQELGIVGISFNGNTFKISGILFQY